MSFLSKILCMFSPGTDSTVAPLEAKRLLGLPATEKPVLIDVRTPGEWKDGHLSGAKHLDVSGSKFDAEIDKLPKEASYLLYCRSGGRSGMALSRMKAKGFTSIKHVSGGIGSWQAAGYPIVK